MRAQNRMKAVAVIAPLLLLGVMVSPAQAAVTIHSCAKDGFLGSLRFSSATTPLVSYKITKGANSGGNQADISVADGGTNPTRFYSTVSGIQDGLWHSIQGPYNRLAGNGIAVTFSFDKSLAFDPTCFITAQV